MQKEEERFRKNIYNYCVEKCRSGDKVLYTAFTYLWPKSNNGITPKNLAVLTSNIINDLIKQKIIIEVPKPKLGIIYGMYEILPHQESLKY